MTVRIIANCDKSREIIAQRNKAPGGRLEGAGAPLAKRCEGARGELVEVPRIAEEDLAEVAVAVVSLGLDPR